MLIDCIDAFLTKSQHGLGNRRLPTSPVKTVEHLQIRDIGRLIATYACKSFNYRTIKNLMNLSVTRYHSSFFFLFFFFSPSNL